MTNWILPEGIDESLPGEARWIETVRRELIDMYRSWGYELLMPPFIEYLDSLLISSPTLDLQTFKLTDQLSGKMMGVRADMTPQVARIDAHRLKCDGPARYCYMGTVLKTRPDNFAGSRSPLQIGVEFYGHAGVQSDLEVIRLMLDTLSLCGIQNIHLDLGHMGVFNRLIEQTQLTEDEVDRVFNLLQRKAVTDLDRFIDERDVPTDIAAALVALPELNGGAEVFERAANFAALATEDMQSCLQKTQRLAESLRGKYADININFDLSELSGYRYQNGVVFAAYVPGEGSEVARGGRYDGIGESFGEARAATGFSADLKNLMRLSQRKIIADKRRIAAPEDADPALQEKIEALRAEGHVVVNVVAGENMENFTDQLQKRDESWHVVATA